jgi:hypothetical protein
LNTGLSGEMLADVLDQPEARKLVVDEKLLDR